MAQKINLAQALKLKKRLIAKLNPLLVKIRNSNIWQDEVPPTYNVEDLLKEYASITAELTDLKVKIHIANNALMEKVYRLAELKTLCTVYKQLSTLTDKKVVRKQATFSRGIESPIEERTAYCTITELERDEKVRQIEKEIEDLQDEIDTYNHVTMIELA